MVGDAVPAGPCGLVIVDKPAQMTSHDVVARVRRLLGTRKVGHAGTLDPMATGVLVIGVGRATRLLGHLMLTEKAYDATVRLGVATTTDDAEGETTSTATTAELDEAAVRAAFAEQVGDLDQVPTAVSAIKVDGKRAYQRVRDGETVQLTARRVTVRELTVHDVLPVVVEGVAQEPSRHQVTDVRISVRCSSGTYIRAIARDVGARLDVGGHLIALRRTAVGAFDLSSARTLEDLGLNPGDAVLPIAAAARSSFPSVDLGEEQAAHARVGRALDLDLGGDAPVALFDPAGGFLALYWQRGDRAVATAVFV